MRKKVVSATIMFLVCLPVDWAGAEGRSAVRARPPEWTDEAMKVFFQDARKHLQGERPRSQTAVASAAAGTGAKADVPGDLKWSALIEPDALTTEIKRTHTRLTPLLARAGRFKAGASADARRELSLLAELFGVVGQYDQQIRWQQQSAGLRGLCSRAAAACEQANDESLAEAVEAHAQISELLSGQSTIEQTNQSDAPIDRGQLMQRMELALEENISPWLANEREFRRHKADVAQESQLLAMLARIVCREQFEYADDEGFVEIAQNMGEASQELTEASRQGNYSAARQAAGQVTHSCSDCHDGYRG
jgi:cytochrome c556